MPIRQESRRTLRTRDAVLSAAVDLLLHGGTGAVTIEAVVQASGVARSTIYRHWPTRADVVAAAFATLMPPIPHVEDDGGLREQLYAVLEPLADQMRAEAFAALVPALLAGAARDPELAPFRDRFVQAQREPLLVVLRRGSARGELAAGADLDELVSQLVGPLFFHRVILDGSVDAALARRVVDAVLTAHARPRDA